VVLGLIPEFKMRIRCLFVSPVVSIALAALVLLAWTPCVTAATSPPTTPQTPASSPPIRPLSNPDASPESKNVYRYIQGLYGKAILAGQQESTWVNRNPDDEMDYIKQNTGKLPAIRGLDYMAYNGVTERAIAWWKQGEIPSILGSSGESAG